MSKNDITGDTIKSKGYSKYYDENYDRIFRSKPQSLDAAYERQAMYEGMVKNPVFPENQPDWDEERIDTIGSNGNDGLHYTLKTVKDKCEEDTSSGG